MARFAPCHLGLFYPHNPRRPTIRNQRSLRSPCRRRGPGLAAPRRPRAAHVFSSTTMPRSRLSSISAAQSGGDWRDWALASRSRRAAAAHTRTTLRRLDRISSAPGASPPRPCAVRIPGDRVRPSAPHAHTRPRDVRHARCLSRASASSRAVVAPHTRLPSPSSAARRASSFPARAHSSLPRGAIERHLRRRVGRALAGTRDATPASSRSPTDLTPRRAAAALYELRARPITWSRLDVVVATRRPPPTLRHRPPHPSYRPARHTRHHSTLRRLAPRHSGALTPPPQHRRTAITPAHARYPPRPRPPSSAIRRAGRVPLRSAPRSPARAARACAIFLPRDPTPAAPPARRVRSSLAITPPHHPLATSTLYASHPPNPTLLLPLVSRTRASASSPPRNGAGAALELSSLRPRSHTHPMRPSGRIAHLIEPSIVALENMPHNTQSPTHPLPPPQPARFAGGRIYRQACALHARRQRSAPQATGGLSVPSGDAPLPTGAHVAAGAGKAGRSQGYAPLLPSSPSSSLSHFTSFLTILSLINYTFSFTSQHRTSLFDHSSVALVRHGKRTCVRWNGRPRAAGLASLRRARLYGAGVSAALGRH